MLPMANMPTLSRYLLSAAETIHAAANGSLGDAAPQRLRECATIIARVAQQITDADGVPASAADEAYALEQAEVAFARDEADRTQAGLRPPPPSDRRIERDALERVLRGHAEGGPDLAIDSARLLPGGRCKLTALVHQSGGAALPGDFILRQDWAAGATDTSVVAEHRLLERVSAAGIAAPRPLLLEPSDGPLGAPFLLLERMPGAIAGSLFTPPRSATLGLQLADQMGRLHGLPPEDFAGLAPRGETGLASLDARLDGFRAGQARIGLRSRIIDAAIDWLGAHLDDAGDAIALTHNDLGFHNFLVEGDRLTAVLDWELAALAHPAADLGYVKPFVALMLPWDEFAARYEQAGGWRIVAPELRFHTIWNAVRLYGLVMQARAGVEAGLLNDVEITMACADNIMLLLNALAGELRAAGAL